MPLDLLVFYGSYRSDRVGIRLAHYLMTRLIARGNQASLIDAREVGLPMLDRTYKEYAIGDAPANMTVLAEKIRAADGFIIVAGEYNWGVQPGLKNLTDHYLEEWTRRPATVASYSSGRLGGARSNLSWHGILSELGMAMVPGSLTVGLIAEALDSDGNPQGDPGRALERASPSFLSELEWWADASRFQRAKT